MKRKPIILLLVGFFASGLTAWLGYAPTPTISFIEFREGQSIPARNGITRVGRVAVFRITNDSRSPYSFFGYAPSWPFYLSRSPDPSDKSGWVTTSPRKWGGVADTIEPHSTIDIHVHLNASDVQMPGDLAPSDYAERLARADLEAQVPLESQRPFAIGIHFERGTAEQLQSRDSSPSTISRFIYRLRCRIDPKYFGPEPTWSTLAQAR